MAFLCPARRRKGKKNNGQRDNAAPYEGRITGSSSIDTLVRVGLEKERGPRARMVVIHDFTPCVEDELEVKRGQQIHVLYQENDWLYVITDEGKEGFVPYTYCLPLERSVDDFALFTPAERTAKIESSSSANSKNSSNMLKRSSSKSMPDITALCENSESVKNQGYIMERGDLKHTTRQINGKENKKNSTGHKNASGVANMGFTNMSGDSYNYHIAAKRTSDKKDKFFKPRERSDSFKEATLNPHTQSQTPSTLQRSKTGSLKSFKDTDPGPSHKMCSYTGFDTIRSSDVLSTYSSREALLQPVIKPFTKTPQGKFIVLFSFNALEEGDITIQRGEFVTLLNRDDRDWSWVARTDGMEGFVPTSFLCQAEGQSFENRQNFLWNAQRQVSSLLSPISAQNSTSSKLVKLVCMQDYHAVMADDLSVKRGDWVYTNLDNQKDNAMIYVYTMNGERSGNIPRTCAKPVSSDSMSRDPYISP